MNNNTVEVRLATIASILTGAHNKHISGCGVSRLAPIGVA